MLAAGLVGVPIGMWILPSISLAAFKAAVGAVLIGLLRLHAVCGRARAFVAGGRGAETGVASPAAYLAAWPGCRAPCRPSGPRSKGWPKEERRVFFQAFNMTILSAMLVASLVQGLIGRRFLLA